MSRLFEVKLSRHGILRKKSIRFARNYVRVREKFSSVQDSPFPYHFFIKRRTKVWSNMEILHGIEISSRQKKLALNRTVMTKRGGVREREGDTRNISIRISL